MDGFRHLLDVIGIHYERIVQFATCAGKAAQHEYSIIIFTRRHKLFGHKVHSIVQRGDQAEIRGPVESSNFLVAMMPLAKHNWFPIIGTESPINSLRFGLHLGQEFVVTPNVSAAWGSNLDEGEFALIAWIPFQ